MFPITKSFACELQDASARRLLALSNSSLSFQANPIVPNGVVLEVESLASSTTKRVMPTIITLNTYLLCTCTHTPFKIYQSSS